MQLGVLGHLRLHEQRGHAGIESCREPVDGTSRIACGIPAVSSYPVVSACQSAMKK
jgi:hypothetical protein